MPVKPTQAKEQPTLDAESVIDAPSPGAVPSLSDADVAIAIVNFRDRVLRDFSQRQRRLPGQPPSVALRASLDKHLVGLVEELRAQG